MGNFRHEVRFYVLGYCKEFQLSVYKMVPESWNCVGILCLDTSHRDYGDRFHKCFVGSSVGNETCGLY